METVKTLATICRRRLHGFYSLSELNCLVKSIGGRVVIQNTMTSEREAKVIAVLADPQDGLTKNLYPVPTGEAGRADIMREDYLPYEGRIICRLAHRSGDQVWLPPLKSFQEVVIITKAGIAIRLMPGDELRARRREVPDEEYSREINSVFMGG